MNEKEIKRRNSIQLKFGRHIANLRKANSLTAEQLADLCDMERSAIARIETGGINPSLFIISKLSDAFKMTISELMEGFNHNKK